MITHRTQVMPLFAFVVSPFHFMTFKKSPDIKHVLLILQVSTSSYEEEEDEEEQELAVSSLPTDVSLTSSSTAARAFSSDSGFSSELCDSKTAGIGEATPSPPPKSSLNRSKWTASFRKLIHRVSKR